MREELFDLPETISHGTAVDIAEGHKMWQIVFCWLLLLDYWCNCSPVTWVCI